MDLSKQEVKSKIEEFERRLEVKGEKFTQEEVFRYWRVLQSILRTVEAAAARIVYKEISHNDYVIYNMVGVKILKKLMAPPFNDPVGYARENWGHCFEVDGLYSRMMTGEHQLEVDRFLRAARAIAKREITHKKT